MTHIVHGKSKNDGIVSTLDVTLRPDETAGRGRMLKPVQVSVKERETKEVKSASIHMTLSLSKKASVPVIPEDAIKAQGKLPVVEFKKPTGNSKEMCCNRELLMSLNDVNDMDTIELLLEVPQGPKRETLRQAVQGVPIFSAKSSEV